MDQVTVGADRLLDNLSDSGLGIDESSTPHKEEKLVDVDGGYGKKTLALKDLDYKSEQFVAEVYKDQSFYLEGLCSHIPDRHSTKGTTGMYQYQILRRLDWPPSHDHGYNIHALTPENQKRPKVAEPVTRFFRHRQARQSHTSGRALSFVLTRLKPLDRQEALQAYFPNFLSISMECTHEC
ncbi:MAG: hypothetical protein AB7U29_10730 [Desulfobulbus sp.]